jgi:hypothetical protein
MTGHKAVTAVVEPGRSRRGGVLDIRPAGRMLERASQSGKQPSD